MAAIIRDGLERMYVEGEDIFYYLTLYNQDYPSRRGRRACDEDILRGIYRVRGAPDRPHAHPAQLVGSGAILLQVLAAQELLAEKLGVAADVWSAPSFQQLRNDALAVERWNRLHPDASPRASRSSAGCCRRGRSDRRRDGLDEGGPRHGRAAGSRRTSWRSAPTASAAATRARRCAALRDRPPHIAAATLAALARCGAMAPAKAAKGIRALGVDPDKTDPLEL